MGPLIGDGLEIELTSISLPRRHYLSFNAFRLLCMRFGGGEMLSVEGESASLPSISIDLDAFKPKLTRWLSSAENHISFSLQSTHSKKVHSPLPFVNRSNARRTLDLVLR